jgi:hypothetical protein
MNGNRPWIQIVTLGTAIACVLALLIAILGTAAGELAADPEPGSAPQSSPEPATLLQSSPTPRHYARPEQNFEGMVTDSVCGARHKATIGEAAGNCARACVHAGASFALIDGDKVYTLEGDYALLKPVAGQRVRILGSQRGNAITVTAVAGAS